MCYFEIMYRLRCVNNLNKINFLAIFTQQFKEICHYEQIFNNNAHHIKGIHLNRLISNRASITSNITKSRNLTNENDEINEKEYLVKIKNDPDKFGQQEDVKIFDVDDKKEEEYLQNPPSKQLSTKQYADIIKTFIGQRKIKEAIDVLEIRMLKDDRVKPENYIYNLLLGACGRVGYTKKAFSLYNNMKKRGLQVTGGTYTALFTACANSPWKEDGLKRATHLKNIMIEKQYEPNETNFNAMIKAFGMCGDIKEAFLICDEMLSKGIALKSDTLNFLLQACISDTEAGFRHALLVWRKFITKNIPPSIYSYNLMLRCIRDCGLGNIEDTKDVINHIMLNEGDNQNLLLESGTEETTNNTTDLRKQSIKDIVENRPNLMVKEPHLGNILSINDVKTPQDKLLLVGGYSTYIDDMKNNNVTPDVKTFTQLLDCIPDTLAIEKDILKIMKNLNVKPDLDFYNMLIKKRSMRFDYEGAKEVLNEIKKSRYRPDLITYGVLSLGCVTKEEGESLIEEMRKGSYRLNVEILGTMLKQACLNKSFPYIFFILHTCVSEEIRPNQQFMDTLKKFKRICLNHVEDKDSPIGKSRSFRRGFELFKMEYNNFLNKADPIKEDEVHPWQQFRQTTNTNVRHYKADTDGRFKPRHTSLFRQKKIKFEVIK